MDRDGKEVDPSYPEGGDISRGTGSVKGAPAGILRADLGKLRRASMDLKCLAQIEPASPQPSVDRLSVTFADDSLKSDRNDASPKSMDKVHFPAATTDEENSEEEDYSASVTAIMQRRASTRRSKKRSGRRGSSPFSPDILPENENGRRRSSVFTTSSGDTAITMEDSFTPSVTQDQIFENIKLHKEVLGSVKMQPWNMRKKLRLVVQAKSYIKRHEGALQERLAQSHSTRDMVARCNIYFIKKWHQCKREAANLSNWLIPWERRIKEIESHFGSVVASYFIFLRWLFSVNIVISIVLVAFVAVPEMLMADFGKDPERKFILPEDKYNSTNFLTLWDFEGVFKYSPMFYGWYTNLDLEDKAYRLPLAYFFTGLAVYVYSFVATLRRMAKNSRMSKLSEKEDECIFSWKLFTGWDYMIGNAETAHNRVASIVMSFKEALLEEAEKKRESKSWKLIGSRILVNTGVLGLLFLSAFAVVTVVARSNEKAANSTTWRRNEITVVMSLISLSFPILFELLGYFEHYHPRKQLRLQLARIMVLNLLNLYSLIFALFGKISNMTHDLQSFKPNTTRIPMDFETSSLTRIQTVPTQTTEALFNNCYTICEQNGLVAANLIRSALTNLTQTVLPEIKTTQASTQNVTRLVEDFVTMARSYPLNLGDVFNTNFSLEDKLRKFIDDITDEDKWGHYRELVTTAITKTSTEEMISSTEPTTEPSTTVIINEVLTTIASQNNCRLHCETLNETVKLPLVETGYKTRSRLRSLCWETMFGQELMKLTVMDLVMMVLSTLAIDVLRGAFVRYMNNCWCWDLERTFPQYGDFKVAENILHLVNNQGMVWMGMFFSPGLVILNVFKLYVMMYLRSWAVLTCNVPHEIIFRASRSNNFYFALLLMMLFLCVLPVGYTIVWLEPSWHCGPFSKYHRIFHIFTKTIRKALPVSFHKILDYIASPGIVIPLLMLLVLIIYYLISLTGALREANNDLKIQLRRERTEERRKMFQIADKRRRSGSGGSGELNQFGKWKKLFQGMPGGGKSFEDTPKETSEIEEDAQKSKAKQVLSRFIFRSIKKRKASLPDEPDDGTDTEQHESLPDDASFRARPLKLDSLESGDRHFRRLDSLGRTSTESGKIKGYQKVTRMDSVSSNWSDNIPVITISKTESSECILETTNREIHDEKPRIKYMLKKQESAIEQEDVVDEKVGARALRMFRGTFGSKTAEGLRNLPEDSHEKEQIVGHVVGKHLQKDSKGKGKSRDLQEVRKNPTKKGKTKDTVVGSDRTLEKGKPNYSDRKETDPVVVSEDFKAKAKNSQRKLQKVKTIEHTVALEENMLEDAKGKAIPDRRGKKKDLQEDQTTPKEKGTSKSGQNNANQDRKGKTKDLHQDQTSSEGKGPSKGRKNKRGYFTSKKTQANADNTDSKAASANVGSGDVSSKFEKCKSPKESVKLKQSKSRNSGLETNDGINFETHSAEPLRTMESKSFGPKSARNDGISSGRTLTLPATQSSIHLESAEAQTSHVKSEDHRSPKTSKKISLFQFFKKSNKTQRSAPTGTNADDQQFLDAEEIARKHLSQDTGTKHDDAEAKEHSRKELSRGDGTDSYKRKGANLDGEELSKKGGKDSCERTETDICPPVESIDAEEYLRKKLVKGSETDLEGCARKKISSLDVVEHSDTIEINIEDSLKSIQTSEVVKKPSDNNGKSAKDISINESNETLDDTVDAMNPKGTSTKLEHSKGTTPSENEESGMKPNNISSNLEERMFPKDEESDIKLKSISSNLGESKRTTSLMNEDLGMKPRDILANLDESKGITASPKKEELSRILTKESTTQKHSPESNLKPKATEAQAVKSTEKESKLGKLSTFDSNQKEMKTDDVEKSSMSKTEFDAHAINVSFSVDGDSEVSKTTNTNSKLSTIPANDRREKSSYEADPPQRAILKDVFEVSSDVPKVESPEQEVQEQSKHERDLKGKGPKAGSPEKETRNYDEIKRKGEYSPEVIGVTLKRDTRDSTGSADKYSPEVLKSEANINFPAILEESAILSNRQKLENRPVAVHGLTKSNLATGGEKSAELAKYSSNSLPNESTQASTDASVGLPTNEEGGTSKFPLKAKEPTYVTTEASSCFTTNEGTDSSKFPFKPKEHIHVITDASAHLPGNEGRKSEVGNTPHEQIKESKNTKKIQDLIPEDLPLKEETKIGTIPSSSTAESNNSAKPIKSTAEESQHEKYPSSSSPENSKIHNESTAEESPSLFEPENSEMNNDSANPKESTEAFAVPKHSETLKTSSKPSGIFGRLKALRGSSQNHSEKSPESKKHIRFKFPGSSSKNANKKSAKQLFENVSDQAKVTLDSLGSRSSKNDEEAIKNEEKWEGSKSEEKNVKVPTESSEANPLEGIDFSFLQETGKVVPAKDYPRTFTVTESKKKLLEEQCDEGDVKVAKNTTPNIPSGSSEAISKKLGECSNLERSAGETSKKLEKLTAAQSDQEKITADESYKLEKLTTKDFKKLKIDTAEQSDQMRNLTADEFNKLKKLAADESGKLEEVAAAESNKLEKLIADECDQLKKVTSDIGDQVKTFTTEDSNQLKKKQKKRNAAESNKLVKSTDGKSDQVKKLTTDESEIVGKRTAEKSDKLGMLATEEKLAAEESDKLTEAEESDKLTGAEESAFLADSCNVEEGAYTLKKGKTFKMLKDQASDNNETESSTEYKDGTISN